MAEGGSSSRFIFLPGGGSCPRTYGTGGFSDTTSATVAGTIFVEPGDQEVSTECKHAASQKVNRSIDNFPEAIGLCVVISCEKGYGFGSHIPDIHNGGRMIEDVFGMFGYATLHVRNPLRGDLLALYHVLASSISYPSSYKRLFFFFTGHGTVDHISTEDGLINIPDVISLFWRSNAPKIADIPKIFMFDCCRTEMPSGSSVSSSSHGPDSRDTSYGSNIFTLYTTLIRCASYQGLDGAGVPTAELVKILKDKDHGNLLDLQMKLYHAMVDKGYTEEVMQPVMECTLHEPIFLHKERLEAMKPTGVELKDRSSTSTVTWQHPRHAGHQRLKYYYVCTRPKGQTVEWNEIKRVGASTVSYQLPTSELMGCEVCIQAKYKDVTVNSDTVSDDHRWTLKRCCHRFKECCFSLCPIASCLILAVIFLIMWTVCISYMFINSDNSPSTQLIVADQVISHPMLEPSWLNTLWYEGVSISQSLNPASDNPQGIPVTVINSENIGVKTREDLVPDIYPSYQTVHNPNGWNLFPLNYIREPLYFVKGSKIIINLRIDLPYSGDVLRTATLYIFDSYEDLPSSQNVEKNPTPLKKIDVSGIANKMSTYYYNVTKDTYLFFVLETNTSANYFTLFSNFTFELKSYVITGSAPSNLTSDTFGLNGSELFKFTMFSPPQKRIYLYAHPVGDMEL